MQRFQILILGVLTLVLSTNVISAANSPDDTQLRVKRSFDWLPFFGGSTKSSDDQAEDGESVNEETAVAEDGTPIYSDSFAQEIPPHLIVPQQVQYSSDYPNAVPMETILSKGHVFNNQFQYPIWRVHKYNGIHIKPVAGTYSQGGVQVQQPVKQGTYPPAAYDVPAQVEANVPFSPSQPSSFTNQNNLNNVGSNTQGSTGQKPATRPKIPAELLKLANEFGIKDFSKLPSLDEAMNLLGTTTQEETIDIIKELAATEDGRNLIKQFLAPDDNEASASEQNEQVVDTPTVGGGFYYVPVNAAGMQQFYQIPNNGYVDNDAAGTEITGVRDFDSSINRANTDINIVQSFLKPTQDVNIFQRIAQWTNFLNPAGSDDEVPLPTNDDNETAVSEEDNGTGEQQVDATKGHAIEIPQLPELPSVSIIPGLNRKNLTVPLLYIPNHALPSAKIPGSYIRIKVPANAYRPIDQKYLHQYKGQLVQHQPQRVQIQPRFVRPQAQPVSFKSAPQTAHKQQPHTQVQVQAYELPHKHISTNFIPNHASEEVEHKQQVTEPKPTYTGAKTIISHVGDIPLIRDYDVHKNGPKVVTSYGTIAQPFTYVSDATPNTFLPSFSHQEYDLRPAASEKSENINEKLEKGLIKANKQTHQQQDVSARTALKNAAEELPVAYDTVSENAAENDGAANAAEQARHNHMYENEKAADEAKEVSFNTPQRITSYDTVATGKIHTADRSVINLLPLTMRNALATK